jgi:heterodisulfide reductase subunit A-like polyferredoxin
LCLTVVEPRDQQGRIAQASAAARRAAELLTAEQTRRTHAA